MIVIVMDLVDCKKHPSRVGPCVSIQRSLYAALVWHTCPIDHRQPHHMLHVCALSFRSTVTKIASIDVWSKRDRERRVLRQASMTDCRVRTRVEAVTLKGGCTCNSSTLGVERETKEKVTKCMHACTLLYDRVDDSCVPLSSIPTTTIPQRPSVSTDVCI